MGFQILNEPKPVYSLRIGYLIVRVQSKELIVIVSMFDVKIKTGEDYNKLL